MSVCTTTASADRRKVFWATQQDACGIDPSCGFECAAPGLSLEEQDAGTTIATNDWVRGLVLNILGTDGRKPDTACGYRPGAQGGHWSDSFRGDGRRAGTLVRNIPTSISIRDSVALARATLEADLSKLVNMGVAQKVSVTAAYVGGNVMTATVDIVGPNGVVSRVGLTGQRSPNAWAWK